MKKKKKDKIGKEHHEKLLRSSRTLLNSTRKLNLYLAFIVDSSKALDGVRIGDEIKQIEEDVASLKQTLLDATEEEQLTLDI